MPKSVVSPESRVPRNNAAWLKLAFAFLLFGAFAISANAQRYRRPTPLEKKVQELLDEQYPDSLPGVAVLIMKGDEQLFKGAAGLAELPNKIPMTADHVFRIGSITKQFTATAILKLQKEGKLSIDDDLKDYIPSFPNHGHTITIRHLLNHTSGIKSYTSMPRFYKEFMRKEMTPEELIDEFKYEDMDFAPGEKFLYNNSGYFILGHIIEEVSGMSYADYIRKNFFEPLEMTASDYGSNAKPYPNLAYGYAKDSAGNIVIDQFIDMSLPYSAGAITSTVGDLFKWYSNVMAGKVLDSASLEIAWQPTKLDNGTTIDYGFGWSINGISGSPTIGHGGGINGYLSSSIWLPKEQVFVAVFSNCTCNPVDDIALKLAALAIDKPLEWTAIPMNKKDLEEYVGVYKSEQEGVSDRFIRMDGDTLYSQREGQRRMNILPFEKDKFFLIEMPYTLSFGRDSSGKIDKVILGGLTKDKVWKRSNQAVPVQTEVQVSEEKMKRFVGTYEYNADFSIVITFENGSLYEQATGQEKLQLFAESEEIFFLKAVDAKLHFGIDPEGKVTAMVLKQGDAEMVFKKVK